MKAIDILKHPVGAEFSTQYGRYIKFIPEHIQIVILKLELLEEQNQVLQSLLDLKQQEISVLESKVGEIKTCESCKHRNHLANETDPCNSCSRRMDYIGRLTDYYEPKDIK